MTKYTFPQMKIQAHTFSRFILFKALSSDLTTPAIDCVTFFIVTADWTLDATASTLELILRKLSAWFFCLMAFSAWILAPSMLPFCIACNI